MFAKSTCLIYVVGLSLLPIITASPIERRRRDAAEVTAGPPRVTESPEATGKQANSQAHQNAAQDTDSGDDYSVDEIANITDPSQLLGLSAGETIDEDDQLTLPGGEELISYQQQYKGFPLWDSNIIASKDAKPKKNGVPFELANDDFDEDLDILAAPLFEQPLPDTQKSCELCKTAHNLVESDTVKFDCNITRYVYHDKDKKTVVFADQISLEEQDDPSQGFDCLVDATNANVLKKYPGQEYVQYAGGNLKVGQRMVDLTLPKDTSGMCTLTFSANNGGYEVLDMATGHDETKAQKINFDCNKGPEDQINDSYGPSIDCYDYILKTQQCLAKYAYFPYLSELSDDKTLRFYIHFKKNFANALWNGQGAFFGDGDASSFSTCSSVDTVAHEIGHGIVSKFSHLLPTGESGCINEAFADMTAMMVKWCVRGSVDWIFDSGSRSDDSSSGESTRNLAVNSSTPNFIKMFSEYTNDTEIHKCSGIYSHVFYLLSRMPGWNITKTYWLMFGANRFFWGEQMTMEEGICGVVQFADKLEMDEDEIDQILEAFEAVGVEVPDDCEAIGDKMKPSESIMLEETSGNVKVNVTKLVNAVPLSNLNGKAGSEKLYKFEIPEGQQPTKLFLRLETAPGDKASNADIFVKFGSPPKNGKDYDIKGKGRGAHEHINIPNPKSGIYYILLVGASDYKDVSLTATKLFENYQVLAKAMAKGG